MPQVPPAAGTGLKTPRWQRLAAVCCGPARQAMWDRQPTMWGGSAGLQSFARGLAASGLALSLLCAALRIRWPLGEAPSPAKQR